MSQDLKNRLKAILSTLNHNLIERETATGLALLSLLAGEHFLLIGAPGTAKSELARRLHWVTEQGNYFERLLTKFSVPEELFGPLSIKALENDQYLRLTNKYLPTASIAFIDEVFKANSAILNALLTILNEREFDNGDQRVSIPLLCVIAASNELPQEEELAALYDRFIFRYQVQTVSEQGFGDLLRLKEEKPKQIPIHYKFTALELQDILTQAKQIAIPDDVIELLTALRQFLQTQNLYISDRRWRKVIKILQVSAFTNQQSEVTVWDCYLLQFCLWDRPEQKQLIFNWYQSHLGVGSGFNQERLEKLLHTWESTLIEEQNAKIQLKNALGKRLYRDHNGNQSTEKNYQLLAERDEEPLFLAPPDQVDRTNNNQGYTAEELLAQFFDDHFRQCHIDGQWLPIEKYTQGDKNRLIHFIENHPLTEAKLYTPQHVQNRLQETQEILADIQQLGQEIENQKQKMSLIVEDHLWISPDFIQQALSSLNNTQNITQAYSTRMEKVISGFQQLPTTSHAVAANV